MGVLRTLCLSLPCVMWSAGIAFAENDLVKSFASCAGRFSAELEHAWLLNDPKADAYEGAYGDFVSLLEATTTSDNARWVLHHRIGAKHAHARLLQAASFGEDRVSATSARKTAHHLREQCRMLILGGA